MFGNGGRWTARGTRFGTRGFDNQIVMKTSNLYFARRSWAGNCF